MDSVHASLLGLKKRPQSPPKNLASTIAKDSGTAFAQPHPRSQMPKKPAPQKSLQQVASSYRKSVIEKKGKVREQVDLFLVAQRAQPVVCYHKKGGQKENLFAENRTLVQHDKGMSRGEGGRKQGRPSMSKQGKAKNNSWHPSTSRARQGEHAGEAQGPHKHRQGQSSGKTTGFVARAAAQAGGLAGGCTEHVSNGSRGRYGRDTPSGNVEATTSCPDLRVWCPGAM